MQNHNLEQEQSMVRSLPNQIKFPRIKRELSYDELILDLITDEQLDTCLKEELQESVVGSEQWYRDPTHWLRVRSSPLYKGPQGEKELLEENKEALAGYLSKSCKVFYGIGAGDVELIPVGWELGRGRTAHYCEVIAIDVSRQFLEDFAAPLKKAIRGRDNFTIKYLGIRQKFELFAFPDLKSRLSGSRYCQLKSSFFCFGNTVANFDPDQIFSIFSRNASSGDNLLIGFHKKGTPEEAVELYASIPGFNSLTTSLYNKIQLILSKIKLAPPPIQWSLNPDGDWIEAKSGDIILFRSKRYTQDELTSVAQRHEFEKISAWENEEAGLVLYRKLA